ncbi:hypothetical protein KKA09_00100 [Patescibacteria group bacterium]|nr:hypothetical protein [Patescibacteria group bacterium]
MFIEIIIGIIFILIIVDIYFRLKNHTRFISFLMVSNDTVNKTLANKGILEREGLDRARKEVLDNLKNINPKNYEAYKKALLEMGIDIKK